VSFEDGLRRTIEWYRAHRSELPAAALGGAGA
jgi:dTDP-D-glucose 4,6-dehydratase